ncbi:MAG: hypothetical protein RJB66_122 [Pseudomonadota bacterium]|jgi:uncharacterized protein (DUF2267 family)
MGQKISNHVAVFDQSVDKAREWISELHEELHWISADSVYHLLRAVLQTLRDQISIDEGAHLSAQLPLVLRGTFYECWDPKLLLPKGLGKEEFIAEVKHKMGLAGLPKYDIEKGVLGALLLIKRHVDRGEMDDVIGALQPTMRSFILGGELEAQMRAQ